MRIKNIKFLSLILAITLVMAALVGCTPKEETKGPDLEDPVVNGDNGGSQEIEYPLEVEDQFGNKVTLEKAPEKIVSLIPSHTETLYVLGVGDKIVGIDPFSNYPEEAAEKEVVGDYYGTDLERIIELGTDLVLVYGPGDEDENARLREAGINVLGYLPETIEEVFNTIEEIGKITNKVKEASELVGKMKDKKHEIVEKAKDGESVRVFYELWHEPLSAAGPGSFMDELINLAGGENIAHDAEASYAEYDLEQLIERDPEIYITSEMSEPAEGIPEISAETISERPGYGEITAIKEGRIYLLDGDLLSRPGPRIIDALELIAKTLHPELF